jgi:hypothetical protein
MTHEVKQLEADNRHSLCDAAFFIGLFFYPEDGFYIFPRNICQLSPEYAELYKRSQKSAGHVSAATVHNNHRKSLPLEKKL